MKFSIDKHVLIDPLKRVASALPGRTTIPILTGILFVSDENGLSMTAGNTHVYIKATIQPDDFESVMFGKIVMPGSRFVEIVNKSGDDLTVEVKQLEVTIRSGPNKFKLTGLDFEEYPNIPEIEAEAVTLPGELFKKVVRKTIFATAGEKSSAPIHTGVNFEFSNGNLRATATDRTRMARTEVEIEAESNFSAVVSNDNLSTFLKIAPDANIDFQFGYDGFIAKAKGLAFYSRVLEGKFPDLDRLLKTDFVYSATVNIREMITSLENADIVAKEEKVHKAKMTLTDVMHIEATSDAGYADAHVEITDVEGEKFTVAFNIQLMLDALKSLDSEKARIQFTGNLEPINIKGIDDQKSTHIVLPYRISEAS